MARTTPGNPTDCEYLKYESAVWWATTPKSRHKELVRHVPFGPRDEQLTQEPNTFEIMAAARHTPEFEEELKRLRAHKAAAQQGSHVSRHQMLAADGRPMMNKLLGGR